MQMQTERIEPAALNGTTPCIDVRPIAGRIGAEIRNVDLKHVTPAAFAEIYQALLRHKVLFFRGQTHLSTSDHENFASMFGTPEAHPTIPPAEGSRYVLELDGAKGGRASSWHTDTTFTTRPYKASVLRGVTIPDVGGDTVWANTAAAYGDLPNHLRVLVDSLWAQHSNDYDYAARHASMDKNASHVTNKLTSTIHRVEHPVVHVHPETKERALLLGSFMQRFVGVSQQESQYLYDLLQRYVTRLENTVRWRWTTGDVVAWDNYATQHYAIDDYGDQDRIVQRVSVRGDIPRAIDGSQSRAVQ